MPATHSIWARSRARPGSEPGSATSSMGRYCAALSSKRPRNLSGHETQRADHIGLGGGAKEILRRGAGAPTVGQHREPARAGGLHLGPVARRLARPRRWQGGKRKASGSAEEIDAGGARDDSHRLDILRIGELVGDDLVEPGPIERGGLGPDPMGDLARCRGQVGARARAGGGRFRRKPRSMRLRRASAAMATRSAALHQVPGAARLSQTPRWAALRSGRMGAWIRCRRARRPPMRGPGCRGGPRSAATLGSVARDRAG